MKKLYLLILFLVPLITLSQTDHRISSQEKLQMPSYIDQIGNRSASGVTQPPTSPVRASAEWEEIDALMIAWTSYPTILTQIAQAAQSETKVYIVCSDSNAVKATLTSASVPLANIRFVKTAFNSIWCRDYGQWNVYTNDVDSLALIDWIYNRPRPNDDAVPTAIETYTGLPMYQTTTAPYDLIHTGGNFMCDGFGTGFSSKLILDENPSKTEVQVDSIMQLFMGINRYIKMETLPYDDIHHIDMHIKLLDEETLLVGEYPQGVADGPQIEANLQYILTNFNSVFGTPYKVVRIPMPPGPNGSYPDFNGDYRTYTNSVFVNKTIILPYYAMQYDTIAKRIYEESLPGYKVVGIDCNSIITSLGAIHCITKEVAAADPLLISHQPLLDTYDDVNPYTVTARIEHRSGIQSATIYFRTDTTQPWQSVSMNYSSGFNWDAAIPAQNAGLSIYYYIEAQSVSGKIQFRPMTAPVGYWKFNVLLNTVVTQLPVSKIKMENAFPNPSHGLTCIPVTSDVSDNSVLRISLKNIFGQEVLMVYEGKNNGVKKYFMNTSTLAAGVYILELSTEGEKFSQKIIVR